MRGRILQLWKVIILSSISTTGRLIELPWSFCKVTHYGCAPAHIWLASAVCCWMHCIVAKVETTVVPVNIVYFVKDLCVGTLPVSTQWTTGMTLVYDGPSHFTHVHPSMTSCLYRMLSPDSAYTRNNIHWPLPVHAACMPKNTEETYWGLQGLPDLLMYQSQYRTIWSRCRWRRRSWCRSMIYSQK